MPVPTKTSTEATAANSPEVRTASGRKSAPAADAHKPTPPAPAAQLQHDDEDREGACTAGQVGHGGVAAGNGVAGPLEMEPSKRRMPDNIRRFLLRMQGGKMYLPAAYRIVWFRDELGDDWGVRTNLIEGGHEAGFATVHAEVLNPEGRVIASGMKTESKQDFPAGWVEKAESGAVARALALLGFGTQFTPELDDDGYRPADSPQARHGYPTASDPPRMQPETVRESVELASPAANGRERGTREIWPGPGQCPRCHAPEGKRHARQCLG